MALIEPQVVIGLFGISLLFVAFLLVHRKHAKWLSFEYNGLNFAGSGILAWYALQINDIVFLTINAIWTLVSAYFLYKHSRVKKID
ncbi:MAG: hypothetical protein V1777_03370 [Candidatus Micrarchaeota archaeon]